MTDKPKIYVDSAPLIDLVMFKVGVGIDPEREQDAWHLQQLLRASRDGKIQLLTSTFTIAECTHVNDPAKLDQAKPFYLQLLQSGRAGIALIQPTLSLMEDARNLRWSYGVSLRGMDSIHVAAALRFQCSEFLHRDGKIAKNAPKLSPLGLRVCAPADTFLLPDEYRQTNLIPNQGDGFG